MTASCGNQCCVVLPRRGCPRSSSRELPRRLRDGPARLRHHLRVGLPITRLRRNNDRIFGRQRGRKLDTVGLAL